MRLTRLVQKSTERRNESIKAAEDAELRFKGDLRLDSPPRLIRSTSTAKHLGENKCKINPEIHSQQTGHNQHLLIPR